MTVGIQGHFTAAHQTGYIGFEFNARTHYTGWFHVKVAWEDGSPVSISLIPKDGTTDVYGAYGSNGEISTAGAVPEPGNLFGLGLLALGAVGLRELRRRRAADRSFGAGAI